MRVVPVAVGVIVRNQQVFLTKRAANVHQGNKWEFPGGKVEENETVEDALIRELEEEIGVFASQFHPLVTVDHDYGDKQVRLNVFLVSEFTGEPIGKEGQLFQWLPVERLEELDFPQANQPIVSAVISYLQ